MKEISELNFPDDLRYAQSHEWAKNGDSTTVGITDYAQDQLGDIVFVELPDVGSKFSKGDELGSVESVKAVSEIYAPVGGEVVEINEALADNPALVNESPYDKGWMVKIKADDSADVESLLDKAAYVSGLSGD